MLVIAQEAQTNADEGGGDDGDLVLMHLGGHQGQCPGADGADARGQSVQAINEVHGLGDAEDPKHGGEVGEGRPEGEKLAGRVVTVDGGWAVVEGIGDALDPHAEADQHDARCDQGGGLEDGRDLELVVQSPDHGDEGGGEDDAGEVVQFARRPGEDVPVHDDVKVDGAQSQQEPAEHRQPPPARKGL